MRSRKQLNFRGFLRPRADAAAADALSGGFLRCWDHAITAEAGQLRELFADRRAGELAARSRNCGKVQGNLGWKLGGLAALGAVAAIGCVGLLPSGSASAWVSSDTSAQITVGEAGESYVGTPLGYTSTAVNYFRIPVKVELTDADKYTVSVQATSSALEARDTGGNLVGSLSSVSQPSAYTEIPEGSWGYSAVLDGRTGANLTYTAIPTAASSDSDKNIITQEYAGPGNKIVNFDLAFAAHVAADTPSGVYKDTVTVSLVASPANYPTIHDITNMQDMTPTVCANTATPDASIIPENDTIAAESTVAGKINVAKQWFDDTGEATLATAIAALTDPTQKADRIPRTMLRDLRDDKWYIVEKLADGNCWMTENLALAGNTALTVDAEGKSLSNIQDNFTLSDGSTIDFTPSTTSNKYINAVYNADATNVNNYLANNSNVKESISAEALAIDNYYNVNASTTSDNNLTEVTAHTGAYYAWATAIAANADAAAGTIDYNNLHLNNNENASEDICPAGWELPYAGDESINSSMGPGSVTYLAKVWYGASFSNWTTASTATADARAARDKVYAVWHVSYSGYVNSTWISSPGTRGYWITRTVQSTVPDSTDRIFEYDVFTGNAGLNIKGGFVPQNYSGPSAMGQNIRCVAKRS